MVVGTVATERAIIWSPSIAKQSLQHCNQCAFNVDVTLQLVCGYQLHLLGSMRGVFDRSGNAKLMLKIYVNTLQILRVNKYLCPV